MTSKDFLICSLTFSALIAQTMQNVQIGNRANNSKFLRKFSIDSNENGENYLELLRMGRNFSRKQEKRQQARKEARKQERTENLDEKVVTKAPIASTISTTTATTSTTTTPRNNEDSERKFRINDYEYDLEDDMFSRVHAIDEPATYRRFQDSEMPTVGKRKIKKNESGREDQRKRWRMSQRKSEKRGKSGRKSKPSTQRKHTNFKKSHVKNVKSPASKQEQRKQLRKQQRLEKKGKIKGKTKNHINNLNLTSKERRIMLRKSQRLEQKNNKGFNRQNKHHNQVIQKNRHKKVESLIPRQDNYDDKTRAFLATYTIPGEPNTDSLVQLTGTTEADSLIGSLRF